MKRILSFAIALLLCVSLVCMTTFAATANAKLSGPSAVWAGESFTLTFSLNGIGIFGVAGTLEYDTSILELKETNLKIGNDWEMEFNGNEITVSDDDLEDPININVSLFTMTFKVKANVATGTAVKVSYTGVIATDGKTDAEIGTVSYSATVAAPKSKDNSLKSLTVSNAAISPAFSAKVTDYTAEVPFEVSQLDIKAQANDGKAKVKIDNPNLTPNGTTNVTVTVTAENGSKKTYIIAVKRAQDPNYVASSNNDLAGIAVDGFLLSPVFTAENDQYVIWLPFETESVSVSGTAADSKASVAVEGGSELVAGADNEIKVICTAEDGSQKVYTVIAKRAAAHGGATEPTEPPTEPTEPETQPTEPTTAPTEPQAPVEQETGGGIPWWVLLIVAVVCLVGGAAAGVFGYQYYKKKQ